MNPTPSEWEKDLEEVMNRYHDFESEHPEIWNMTELKALIRSLLSAKDKTPMGVSQWREHGEKFGYWEYFEKEHAAKIARLRAIVSGLSNNYAADTIAAVTTEAVRDLILAAFDELANGGK